MLPRISLPPNLPLNKQRQGLDSEPQFEASNGAQVPKGPGCACLAALWLHGALGCPGAGRLALPGLLSRWAISAVPHFDCRR